MNGIASFSFGFQKRSNRSAQLRFVVRSSVNR